MEEMCNKFLYRGYLEGGVKEHMRKAKETLRSDVRKKKVKMRDKRIPFVSTFNTASGQLRSVILKHWHILHQGLPEVEEFTCPPILLYKRGCNLKDKLVKSDIGPTNVSLQRTLGPPKLGNFPCLGCACCGNLIKGEFFNSLKPRGDHISFEVILRGLYDRKYPSKRIYIKRRYTCTSSFVIYLIVCPCGLTYVGETTMEIKARIRKHKSTIRTKMVDLPIPKHFIESGHSVSQLRFRVIDGVLPLRRGGDRVKLLKQKELRWISRLGSRQPGGLNVDYNLQLCVS
ncbi:unnamed protein product [Ranitomeya imitator]|uniref:GIY-YIG domain-containing protein n=1 Tax=Ranitomeya imitator TaxID=111125 RepID=A0ABN9LVB1_9NEOB|nr:unnamed protein product [Ranitomeya imitator]